MIHIFRRHAKRCNHYQGGRGHLRCDCPIWADGRLNNKRIHKSLETNDWQTAHQIVHRWEVIGNDFRPLAPRSISVEQAWQHFLNDLTARNLHPSTIRKYNLLSRQMTGFAKQWGLEFINEFDLTKLSDFRNTWRDAALSSSKKLERLRSFLQFSLDRNWINENPGRKLKRPKVSHRPTLPFTNDEMMRILACIETYVQQTAPIGLPNAHRLKALVLVLRYSGMRIGDVVRLTTDKLRGNKLLLYTQKTGVPVNTVLPEFVLRVLENSPLTTAKHYFWSGERNADVIVGSWQKRLRKLFCLADVTGGHAHRFRDTFAVELLLAGIPIERVSVLLGHQSVRVTEKHYSPWVRSRQEQLEADLQQAWTRDPLVLLEAKVTRRLHGNGGAVN